MDGDGLPLFKIGLLAATMAAIVIYGYGYLSSIAEESGAGIRIEENTNVGKNTDGTVFKVRKKTW